MKSQRMSGALFQIDDSEVNKIKRFFGENFIYGGKTEKLITRQAKGFLDGKSLTKIDEKSSSSIPDVFQFARQTKKTVEFLNLPDNWRFLRTNNTCLCKKEITISWITSNQ